MKENEISIPYVAHEGMQVRLERTIRRLIYALILAVVLMFASNGLWLYAWIQYDYESSEETITTSYMQDGRGLNIIGMGNEVIGDGADGNYREEAPQETEAEEEWEGQNP